MKKAILIDPFSGASGDMLIASLIDTGLTIKDLSALSKIPALKKTSVRKRAEERGVFHATRFFVSVPKEKKHRHLSTITQIIEKAPLSDRVKERSLETFTRLARAEAKVHGITIDKVHFHEVGALDAIIDIVGWYILMEHLGWPDCYYTRIVLGSGSTTCDHGVIPLPAPATLELLRGQPVTLTERKEELVTPTAAAIISTSFKELPDGMVVVPERVGYGAGSRKAKPGAPPALPNVLRTIIGTIEETPPRVGIITTTIDDMNPEVYGFIMEKLFSEGALDVYYNSVMMKKNRPGVELVVITEEEDIECIASLLLTHTTTIGLRVNREERIELPRRKDAIHTGFGRVRLKIVELPGGGERMSPEYESCRKAAEKHGVPIMDVFQAAREAWNNRGK